MFRNKKNNLYFLALIISIGLILSYANHFNNTFHFDDSHTIQTNPAIRNLNNIPKFFYIPQLFSSLPKAWGIRPLVSITLAIDYWLAGDLDPFYFQLSTFIWYIISCIFLFFIIRNILRQTISHNWTDYAALLMTGLYAMHAANAETVNYIIARSDVLSTFFILLSFLIYISYPEKRKMYLYIIPALIGVFAKETVLTLIIILFFYILLFEEKKSIPELFHKKNFNIILKSIGKLLPIFICVALLQFYTLHQVKSVPGISNPWGYYVLTQSYIWLRYFIAFFIPANLSADTDWTVIRNIFDERIIIGLTFIILYVWAIVKYSSKKETRPTAFGLIWFGVALLPTSLAPFSEVTNDHRMFYAFIGLSLAVGNTLFMYILKLQERNIFKEKALIRGIFIFTCIVFSLHAYGIYQRNKVWHTEESLWLDVTEKSPANGRGLMNYGLTQMAKGNYSDAKIYFEKALIYAPNYDVLFINLGVLDAATNKPEEAESYFKRAIALNKNSSDESYFFYARFLKDVQRNSEAIEIAKKATIINPYNTQSLFILADIYANQQQWSDLINVSNQILAINPKDAKALDYLHAGQNKQPLLTSTPTKALTADDYINKSLVYYNQKEFRACIDACYQSLKLQPNNANAYNNIGAAYNSLGEWQKGYDACKKALEINPNFQLAKANLEWAKKNIK